MGGMNVGGPGVRSWRMASPRSPTLPESFLDPWLLQPSAYLVTPDPVRKQMIQQSVTKLQGNEWDPKQYFLFWVTYLEPGFFLANKIVLRSDSCFFNASEVCSVILLVWHPNSKWNTWSRRSMSRSFSSFHHLFSMSVRCPFLTDWECVKRNRGKGLVIEC